MVEWLLRLNFERFSKRLNGDEWTRTMSGYSSQTFAPNSRFEILLIIFRSPNNNCAVCSGGTLCVTPSRMIL
jgi:hypothetical protein